MKWTPMRRLRAAGPLEAETRDEVIGRWRGNLVWVQYDEVGWYIRVIDSRGCYSYDGYWRESYHKTAEEAVAEAFRGACLLEPA